MKMVLNEIDHFHPNFDESVPNRCSPTFPLTEEGDAAIGFAIITEQTSFWHAQCAQLAFTLTQWGLGGSFQTNELCEACATVDMRTSPQTCPSTTSGSVKWHLQWSFPQCLQVQQQSACPQLTPCGKLRGNSIEPATLAQA